MKLKSDFITHITDVQHETAERMMSLDGLTKTGEQLLYLMSCALRGANCESEYLNKIDLDELYSLASEHCVLSMVCTALKGTEVFGQANGEARNRWLEAENKAVRNNILLDNEREVIIAEMESAGIWHMPLKGCIIKTWYPKFGMREMADNDILFDVCAREQVKKIFAQHGYSVNCYGTGNQDVYIKPPVYNFEMHTQLFSEDKYKSLTAKYADIKNKLVRDSGSEYGFHFTNEDFYVYVTAHAYKHYINGGIGIRTLADIYVINQKIGNSLDWDYIQAEMKEIGILDYEKQSRDLAYKVFGGSKIVSELSLTHDEQNMLLFYMSSGAYGNEENKIYNRLHSIQGDENRVSRLTKLKYCFKRLFPGRNSCKKNHPFVYSHPWILPIFWIWRIFKKLLFDIKGLLKELFTVKSSE